MIIDIQVWRDMFLSLGSMPPECGGILGQRAGTVIAFYFDKEAKTSRSSYYPEIQKLNRIILQWAKTGIQFTGIIHSHQNGDMRLSKDDLSFAREIILKNESITNIYFPIVSSVFDYQVFSMTAYRVSASNIVCEKITIKNSCG